jgi:DNA primase catalytic core
MPYIKENCAHDIKDRVDIEDVVSNVVDLKKRGTTITGLCPFHKEKTPSFTINKARQTYKCFGCGKSGNAITFIMEHRGISYPEALIEIAQIYQIPVEYDNSEQALKKAEEEKKRQEIRPILIASLGHYQRYFQSLPADHPGKLEVYQKRLYTDDVVLNWGIGYAPGGTFIYDMLKEKNLLNEGREIGLIGDKADKFWNRVIYPIYDKNGLLVGLGGRDTTNQSTAAKWINSKESRLYVKQKVWFGLDKAAKFIVKSGIAWIVEGYNDVISLAINGKENVVASCGTAITGSQIKILSKYCKRVVLALDPDSAGVKATLSAIPLFIRNGIDVQIFNFPFSLDADDFCRAFAPFTWDGDTDFFKGGFFYLVDHYLQADNPSSEGVHYLIDIVKDVKDEVLQGYYLKEVSKKSKLTEAVLKNLMAKKVEEIAAIKATEYLMPKGMAHRIDELKPTIEKYGLFIADNRVWIQQGKKKPFHFNDVTNFSIEYMQHITDEERASKLIKMTNIYGDSYIFDTLSEKLNTPIGFDNAVSNYGNFNWYGDHKDFKKLRTYLMDKMGNGSKIEVLGWQPAGFFAFNNAVIVPGQGLADMTKNGVVKFDKTSYYIPSANEVYKHKMDRYHNQKLMILKQAKQPFSEFGKKMIRVHREHAITAMLHAISTIFRDAIMKKVNFFPILFFYGPPSTGKDELVAASQSFFGEPQSKINIGADISTVKAQIRKFAQFSNIIVYLTEYTAGNPKINEKLKGIWGGEGYDKGSIESNVSTDTVAILSSLILSGNQYPDNDALITRLIIEEMVKSDFDNDDAKAFSELDELLKNGISSYTRDFVNYRDSFVTDFKANYNKCKQDLKEKIGNLVTEERMFNNAAVYGSTLLFFSDKFDFPFTYQDFLNHIKAVYSRQVRKLNTGSKLEKFWNLFLAAVRMENDPLQHGREFTINGSELAINMTHTYNRVSQMWWGQYQEKAPTKTDIMDTVQRNKDLFKDTKNTHRFSPGKTGVRSSAWILNLEAMNIKEDLLETVEWKESKNNKEVEKGGKTNELPW